MSASASDVRRRVDPIHDRGLVGSLCVTGGKGPGGDEENRAGSSVVERDRLLENAGRTVGRHALAPASERGAVRVDGEIGASRRRRGRSHLDRDRVGECSGCPPCTMS